MHQQMALQTPTASRMERKANGRSRCNCTAMQQDLTKEAPQLKAKPVLTRSLIMKIRKLAKPSANPGSTVPQNARHQVIRKRKKPCLHNILESLSYHPGGRPACPSWRELSGMRFSVARGGAGEPSSELFTRVAVLWVVVPENLGRVRLQHSGGSRRAAAFAVWAPALTLGGCFTPLPLAGTGGGLARDPPPAFWAGDSSRTPSCLTWGGGGGGVVLDDWAPLGCGVETFGSGSVSPL